MSRYFFHLRDGEEHLDHDGVELAEAQVGAAAVVAAGEAIKDLGARFFDGSDWTFWVTNEAGGTVLTLRLTAEPSTFGRRPSQAA